MDRCQPKDTGMTDLKTLKQLVKLMVDHDLTELDVEGEGHTVRLKRGQPNSQPVVVEPMSVVTSPAVEGAVPAAPDLSADSSGVETIVSPMVGTFYSAPSPDAKPFVGVGDGVSQDSVVCIIEAMKVFNEIKAEKSGTIVRILVESGQSVEFDQPLFEIKLV